MQTLKEISRKVTPIADKHNLNAVYVFGSYARGDATENSDIDLLIDRDQSNIRGMLGMIAFQHELEEALRSKIDVVTTRAMRQDLDDTDFLETVEHEKRLVYERR